MYQWETILRSVAAHQSYRHVYKDRYRPPKVAEFLILSREMPRSLRYSANHVMRALAGLSGRTGGGEASLLLARDANDKLRDTDIPAIFKYGLHGFLSESLQRTADIANTAATDYHFN